MFSVAPVQHEVNGIRLGLCPACKCELSKHLPSVRQPRQEPGKITVVLGRCCPDDTPAAQKLSWSAMSQPLTEGEYRAKYTDRPPPLNPCPGCGGPLNHHGGYQRKLGEKGSALVTPLPIYRGLCTNSDCPVVTVTHFPHFVTPYEVAPIEQREEIVRARVEGQSWASLERRSGYSAATVRHWVRRVNRRAAEITVGLLAVLLRLDAQAEVDEPGAVVGEGAADTDRLRNMFRVIDAVAGLLAGRGAWRQELPGLALPRALSPPGVSPLPVWA